MKNIVTLASLLVFSVTCCGQIKEIVYNNPKDSTTNYYYTFKANGQVKGLLLLLTSFGENLQTASNETDIQKVATDKGLITVFASLQYGTQTFFVDSLSQNTLDNLIVDLQKRYGLTDKPFYLGGFSLGGSGVVKYAERAYTSKTLIRPKAIFAIDPPLDLERMYLSLEQTVKQSKVEVAKMEAEYFIKRLEYEFQGNPHQYNSRYHNISPYSYTDTLQKNIKPLINCPIMLISEPDIIWQMEERNRSLYDLNTLDCSSVINSLKLLGNKNATLVITTGKGYRKLTGKRNPHSWSIANAEQTVNWLLQY
jgi:hypothetical protein